MIARVASVAAKSSAPTSPGCLCAPPPKAMYAAKSTATTMPTTAIANSTTSRVDARRAAAWCSKKFIGSPGLGTADSDPQTARASDASANPWSRITHPGPSELHLRRLAHLGLVGRGISSNAAGANWNMPATTLDGKTSRRLL